MLSIPKLGIGTYKIGKTDVYNIVKKALKMGYRHIDTASLYRNEVEIGKAINDSGVHRKDIFITTKIWIRDIRKGRNGIIKSINKSLKNLNTNYIDAVLLHIPLKEQIKESWLVLEDIYRGKVIELKGKIIFIGVSNYNINELKIIIEQCTIKPYINQIELSPFFQRRKLVQYCNKNNINIVAHTSLIRGMKFEYPIIKELSQKYKTTPAIIFLKWALMKGFSIIPGTKNPKHLIENMDVDNIKIETVDINKLDDIKETFYLFPYRDNYD